MKNKVKYYREMKGISQEELAEKSGISRTTISGFENETIKVTTNSRILRAEVEAGFGYVIRKGKAVLMKLMSDE